MMEKERETRRPILLFNDFLRLIVMCDDVSDCLDRLRQNDVIELPVRPRGLGRG